MHRNMILVPALAGTLLLGGCFGGGNPPNALAEPGGQTVFADISASTPFLKSPPYASAAIRRVGEAVLHQRTGDRFRIVTIGEKNIENSLDALDAASSQKIHLRTLRKRMEAALQRVFDHARGTGGDGSTSIIYALENAHPLCNPGSRIDVLTDGVEASSEANVSAALAAGQPISLPNAHDRFLSGGCTIRMIGIGVTAPDGSGPVQTLPDDQLRRLTTAWRAWFVSAGADPTKIRFETIL